MWFSTVYSLMHVYVCFIFCWCCWFLLGLFPWSSLIFLFVCRCFKKSEKQDFYHQFLFPSVSFIFVYLCVLTSHHPSVSFDLSALSPHWNSISTFFLFALFIRPSVVDLQTVLSPHVSSDFSLLPLFPSLLLLSPLLLYRRRLERWEVSRHISHVISWSASTSFLASLFPSPPPPATSVPVFFLLPSFFLDLFPNICLDLSRSSVLFPSGVLSVCLSVSFLV